MSTNLAPGIRETSMRDLKDARVAFTGKLAAMTRKEAFQIVRTAGGEPSRTVSRRTSLLVVGMEGWPLLPDGKISRKLRVAQKLTTVRIMPERVFLEFVGLKARQEDLQKTFPAETVCNMLPVELETLHRWELFGLVRSQDGLYDFQDLVSLRTIAELVNAGVKPETIAASLERLASVLPGTDRPLAQLKIVAENPKSILADFREYRLSPGGQLVFNFEPASGARVIAMSARELSAPEWFERGQVCEDEEHYLEAEEAYRKAISLQPHFPGAYFNLGNVLREMGRLDAAEEIFRTATAQDPAMAPAWYNLADIQEERGKLREAIASLRAAIRVSPSYADAHFNLALCLEKAGQQPDANGHWAAYLRLDPGSSWAQVARRHLSLPKHSVTNNTP